jgi:hypothetical protein
MSGPESLPTPDYETGDAKSWVIAITAASLVAIIGLCISVAALLHLKVEREDSPHARPGATELFQNGPEAKTSIEMSWAEVDSSVRRHLDGYEWIDRRAGIVRIPIGRAMDLVAEEHKTPAGSSRGGKP